uniref:acyl-ACP desaturase n=1 Tax=Pedobacter sp. TaxID=1411316 RepID=UPI003D7F5862
MSYFAEKRREVMLHVEGYMLEAMHSYLKPIDTNWQPSDFLPDATSETFFQDVRLLQEKAKDLSYDLVA